MAEKCGLVMKLTDCVVCESFRDHRAWLQEGTSLRLAINISPELLKDSEWCDLFLQRCAEFEVDAEQITLEITESSSGATHPAAMDILTRLRLKGFTLSIDDFGTGFSSLSTLYKLPFGELKIDKSFIHDLQKSAEARALIESTVEHGPAHRREGRGGGRGIGSDIPRAQADRLSRGAGLFRRQVHGGRQGAALLLRLGRHGAQPVHPCRNAKRPAEDRDDPGPAAATSSRTRPIDTDSTLVLADFSKAKAMEGAEEDNTLGLARSIPPLVLQGRTTEALANCHAAAKRLEASNSRPGLKSKIAQLQSLLEQELVTTADIDLVGPHGVARLLPRTLRDARAGRPRRRRWISRSPAAGSPAAKKICASSQRAATGSSRTAAVPTATSSGRISWSRAGLTRSRSARPSSRPETSSAQRRRLRFACGVPRSIRARSSSRFTFDPVQGSRGSR